MNRKAPHYALRRNTAYRVDDFPARPMLDPMQPCHGVVLLDKDEARVVQLRPLRDHVRSIWQGSLGDTPILIALFLSPTTLTPIGRGRMLPLSAAQGQILASFQAEPAGIDAAPKATETDDLRQLDLWWGGRHHRVMVATLRRLSIAALWEMPEVVRHTPRRATVPPTRAASAHDAASRAKRPKEALLPINTANDIRIDDAEARARALHRRTSARAIAAQMWRKMRGARGGEGEDAEGANEPGILTNMAGWLLWHTPLGIPLARQLADRMRLVERLMAAGDVDSALRLALQLGGRGGAQTGKKVYPLRLPKMRDSLDFKINWGGSAPLLRQNYYGNLNAQYDALAKRMEAEGDFKRAAYIRSQLQGTHYFAVDTLERGQLFLDAAKLALDAKLPAVRVVALFYKAGEKDMALALAKRAECFEQLAETSRKDDPEFHAFVLRAWTDQLIITGQPLRALQVTDVLAELDAGNADLAAIRLSWIDMVLDDAPDGFPSAEAVARALLSSAWGEDDAALASFAAGQGVRGAGRNTLALRVLDEWINTRPEMIDAVIATIVRHGNSGGRAQGQFWTTAAPIVIERTIRAFAAYSAGRHSQYEQQGISKLLRMAGLEVLATDWRKLKFQPGASPAKHREWSLPPTHDRAAAAVQGCLLGNNALLIWRETGQLQLYDIYGRMLWQNNMSEVIGLVPIGGGGDALILQPHDERVQIARFATRTRSLLPIGVAALAAWHDISSDGQWLVQWDGHVGALDLAKLCAPSPEFEFLWSAHLTKNVHVVSFMHNIGHWEWLTIDKSDTRRNGMIEAWSMNSNRTLDNSIWDFEPDKPHAPYSQYHWIWHGRFQCKADQRRSSWSLKIKGWTEQGEWQTIALLDKRRRLAPDCAFHFLGCDQLRMSVQSGNGDGKILCKTEGQNSRSLSIVYPADANLTCLARGASRSASKGTLGNPSHFALFAAADGRLLYADVFNQKVTVF